MKKGIKIINCKSMFIRYLTYVKSLILNQIFSLHTSKYVQNSPNAHKIIPIHSKGTAILTPAQGRQMELFNTIQSP